MAIVVRPVGTRDEDLGCVARFLAEVFSRADLYTPAYLRWIYADNPAGKVIGTNAFEDEVLVAHYAVIPIEAESASGRHRAALSLNTATHPAHQGRGIFVRLAEETYARARESGVREIVGIANASSAPGFVSRLGFTGCGPLDARLLWPTSRISIGEPGARPSWRRFWDADSIAWRVRNPSARYRIDRRSGMRTILAPTAWPGIRAVLRCEPEEGAPEVPDLGSAGGAPLRLWLGRRPGGAASGVGGVRIPMRLRPSPLELIHRSLDERAPLPDPDGFHFEAFDFDAY